MADGTKIEWTDATWNVVNGCSLASPGCTNCYAMKQAHRFPVRQGLTKQSKGGMVWTGETRFNEKVLLDPIRWQRPRRIFVCAHGDLFHESVPDEWVDKVFAVMALAPQHQFQVLTKRAARMRRYMESIDNGDGERLEGFRSALIEGMAQSIYYERTKDETVSEWLAVHLPLTNVWLGVSVEDQTRADERIPDLLAMPAAVRWLSCEPLLGPVDLGRIKRFPSVAPKEHMHALLGRCCTVQTDLPNPDPAWAYPGVPFSDGGRGIDWVVAGGESGHKARPMHPDWARSLRDQCAAADVPFLFKQWGEWAEQPDAEVVQADGLPDANLRAGRITMMGASGIFMGRGFFPPNAKGVIHMDRVGKKQAGRLLDGVQHDGFPA